MAIPLFIKIINSLSYNYYALLQGHGGPEGPPGEKGVSVSTEYPCDLL